MTIIESPVLIKYRNGNVSVTIHEDGSKVREFEGEPHPIFPESIDLKITDYCTGGCKWCHESSTPKGFPASVNRILEIVDGLPRGVEIAIGGGDPFTHPDLEKMLGEMRYRGLITSITVNGLHIGKHKKLITELRKKGLFYGLGVSYGLTGKFWPELEGIKDDNTVLHVIIGKDDTSVMSMAVVSGVKKILIMGYKEYGRGKEFLVVGDRRLLGAWKAHTKFILELALEGSIIVCFDNLALEQLGIRDMIDPKVWAENYMGVDGMFTMYVDAVKDRFAVSSTSERFDRGGLTVQEMFGRVREGALHGNR